MRTYQYLKLAQHFWQEPWGTANCCWCFEIWKKWQKELDRKKREVVDVFDIKSDVFKTLIELELTSKVFL